MKQMFSLALSFIVVLAPDPAFSAQPLGLREAIQFALEHSPTLDSARRSAESADAEFTSAWSRFLPSFDFTSSHGVKRQKTPDQAVTPSNPWTSSIDLALTENLYDNGETLTRYRVADRTKTLTAVTLANAREKLSRDVALEFYTFSLNTKLSEAKHEQYRTLTKQFANVSNQYRQGFKTRQDFLRFKTQVQRAELDMVSADTTIKTSLAQLGRLLGVSYGAEMPELLPLEPSRIDVNKEVPKVAPPLEKNYEFQITEFQRQINALNETFAKRRYFPQIAVSGAATYDNTGYLGNTAPFPTTSVLGWNAQLVLSYNIWDWGIRRRDVANAERQREIQDNTQTEAVLTLSADIDSLMLALERLRRNYVLNDELLELSLQSYNFLEEEYRLGHISYLDIITGLNDLLDAKTRFYSAYFELLGSITRYRYYEGTLYETLVSKK